MAGKKQFRLIRNGLLVRAPAKINLSLLIAGKRPDGFHNIETIMAKVSFYDEILIQKSKRKGIQLICKGPYWAPAGEENLVYKAAKKLLDHCSRATNLKITLTKNIPAGSGLGSASSDAAATLMGLNKLLRLNVKAGQLWKIATELGSDVPFFLDGPLAFCTGKGEKIKKIRKIFNFSAILMLSNINASTKKVYANYKHNSALCGKLSRKIKGLIRKNSVDLVPQMCANMLQKSCFELYKGLSELKATAESLGLGPVCLSGSGSSLFCIATGGSEKIITESKRIIEQKLGCKSVIVCNNRW
jgi:4-diphosphocytidyl-2-C-methyl-D-erythritol kinase